MSSRLSLSLIAALSLGTLAAADSIPAPTALPHPAIGMHNHFSSDESEFAQKQSGVYGNYAPTGESRSTVVTTLVVPRTMGVGSYSDRHRAPEYIRKGGGHGMAAPEPGSLMLLSTGLLGFSGLLRRKLLRG